MSRISRSNALAFLALATLAAGFAGCADTKAAAPAAGHAAQAAHVTAKDAQELLVEGNARFVAGKGQHARQDPGRRTELATSQHPFAVVLGCADSRTGPEVLFDQGLGDLFVVREAGNVLDDHTLGSIEYAAEHLQHMLEKGEIEVVGAYYDLDTGAVTFLAET